MRKSEVVERLMSNAEAVRALGATSLYLFGSVARDEAEPASDIDVFIDYDPLGRFHAFDLISIKLMLEEKLAASVDITTRDGPHPRLRSKIEKSALQVF
ncbi:DNA polymerase III subunit beta [Rhizobium sp. Root1203]|uniref:nucleotidyltransferase family protein n=1 Tax=Rhizobium sp. Root1203 TaxID=1736427 RepID=UPI00070A17C6|nr:nucleotidyltransferase domain-containing protein [Rhizobium sp. Root1203]KQV32692.1 DNA polymerase III subunit beta [Rhizobium sp. Root1203]